VDEQRFQQWASVAGLQPSPKYDLRGYWKALTSGVLPPPAHGSEHALPATWVTPRDLEHFSVQSKYHPAKDDSDVIDQRFPLQGSVWGDGYISPSFDLRGQQLPVTNQEFTDEIASNPRVGNRTRSDARLSALEAGATPAEWSTPPSARTAAPIERANIVRPPARQRSHTQPRGTR